MQILYSYLLFAFIASSALAFLAWSKHSLTYPALALAWFCAFFITCCSGLGGFLILAMVFVLTIVSDKIGRNREQRKKSEQRKAIQIFANVGTGTFVLLVGAVFQYTSDAFFIYSAVMATSLADSMASGIGVLSPHDPISITTFRKIPRGRSGGVTLLGLSASLLGSLVVAVIYYLFAFNFLYAIFILLTGFLGCLFDSFLGAAFQGKFTCSVDHCYTEKRICHGKPSIPESGFTWIDNNIVNLFNNLFSSILSLLILLIVHSI